MLSYFDGMLRYFEFSGRSSRRQYWMFWLVASLLCAGALYADFKLYGIRFDTLYPGPFTAFAGIVHAIPAITVTVRRLHDIGRSGWFYFIQLIPIIGSLVLLYWMIVPPKQWDNAYGADPRDGAADDSFSRTPRSTIPRQVRMGNASPQRPAHLSAQGEVQRFI